MGKTIAVIPARGGSKGVKDKNIKLLGSKPLLAYTIESALASDLDEVIVSTDSEKIAAVAQEFGAKVPFIRPAELATDSAKAIPVMLHALQFMEAKLETTFEALMMLQPTSPFKRASDINQALKLLKETSCDSVISVVDVEGYHPARMKFLQDGKLIDPPFCEAYENQPRQELTKMYIRNGAIYLTRRSILLQESFKGNDCRALIMEATRSVNIDTELDFRYAEWIMRQDLM